MADDADELELAEADEEFAECINFDDSYNLEVYGDEEDEFAEYTDYPDLDELPEPEQVEAIRAAIVATAPRPAVEVPVPSDYYDDLEEDQLCYDEEWEQLRPDFSRSQTGCRGCLVSWHCRLHPAPNEFPGCETACLWTYTAGAEAPHCWGHYRGTPVVAEGELLHPVLQRLCESCPLRQDCARETELRG